MWILSPTSKPTLRHRAGCCVTPQNHFIHSHLKQFLPINELLSFFFFFSFSSLLVFLKCFLHYCMHLPSSPSFILAFLKSPYISAAEDFCINPLIYITAVIFSVISLVSLIFLVHFR